MSFIFSGFFFFFGFVYHVSRLPWFETKNKIRCINAPKNAFTHRNLPESEKYMWIIQNEHEKSRFFYISIKRWQPDTRLSPPLRRQSNFSSAASHQCLWDIAAALLDGFFIDIIGSQKHIPTYNTDRLLEAGNDVLFISDCITKRQFSMQLTDFSNWWGLRLKFVIPMYDSAATLEDLGLSS